MCLDDHELFQLLFREAEDTAKADMPESVRKAMKALQNQGTHGCESNDDGLVN